MICCMSLSHDTFAITFPDTVLVDTVGTWPRRKRYKKFQNLPVSTSLSVIDLQPFFCDFPFDLI